MLIAISFHSKSNLNLDDTPLIFYLAEYKGISFLQHSMILVHCSHICLYISYPALKLLFLIRESTKIFQD